MPLSVEGGASDSAGVLSDEEAATDELLSVDETADEALSVWEEVAEEADDEDEL